MNRSVEREDNNTLGVHIISFDDTLNNTIQSDNLINGDMSSTTHPSTVVTKYRSFKEAQKNFKLNL